MDDKDKVLSFDREFSSVSDSIENTKDRVQKLDAELSETSILMDEILREMSEIPNALVPVPAEQSPEEACVLELNSVLEDIFKKDRRLFYQIPIIKLTCKAPKAVSDILNVFLS